MTSRRVQRSLGVESSTRPNRRIRSKSGPSTRSVVRKRPSAAASCDCSVPEQVVEVVSADCSVRDQVVEVVMPSKLDPSKKRKMAGRTHHIAHDLVFQRSVISRLEMCAPPPLGPDFVATNKRHKLVRTISGSSDASAKCKQKTAEMDEQAAKAWRRTEERQLETLRAKERDMMANCDLESRMAEKAQQLVSFLESFYSIAEAGAEDCETRLMQREEAETKLADGLARRNDGGSVEEACRRGMIEAMEKIRELKACILSQDEYLLEREDELTDKLRLQKADYEARSQAMRISLAG